MNGSWKILAAVAVLLLGAWLASRQVRRGHPRKKVSLWALALCIGVLAFVGTGVVRSSTASATLRLGAAAGLACGLFLGGLAARGAKLEQDDKGLWHQPATYAATASLILSVLWIAWGFVSSSDSPPAATVNNAEPWRWSLFGPAMLPSYSFVYLAGVWYRTFRRRRAAGPQAVPAEEKPPQAAAQLCTTRRPSAGP
jgi:hypothetical protein